MIQHISDNDATNSKPQTGHRTEGCDLSELAAALDGAFSFQVGSTRIKPLSRSYYLQQEAAN